MDLHCWAKKTLEIKHRFHEKISNWKLPILKKSVKLDSLYFGSFQQPGLFLIVCPLTNQDFGISIVYIILSWSTTFCFFTGVTTTNGSSALIAKGPDEDKIKEILNRTGYKLDVTTGQRKYGGPPPNWEGDPPASGCEVSIQQIFREINWKIQQCNNYCYYFMASDMSDGDAKLIFQRATNQLIVIFIIFQ